MLTSMNTPNSTATTFTGSPQRPSVKYAGSGTWAGFRRSRWTSNGIVTYR